MNVLPASTLFHPKCIVSGDLELSLIGISQPCGGLTNGHIFYVSMKSIATAKVRREESYLQVLTLVALV